MQHLPGAVPTDSRHIALGGEAGQMCTAVDNVEVGVGAVHACDSCTTMLCVFACAGSRYAWLQLVESIYYRGRAIYSRFDGWTSWWHDDVSMLHWWICNASECHTLVQYVTCLHMV